MEEIFNLDNNDNDIWETLSNLSFANAPTPYVDYTAIQDFNFDVPVDNDANNGGNDLNDYSDVVEDSVTVSNVEVNDIPYEATDEQMTYSVRHEDIEAVTVSDMKLRKRKASLKESYDEYDSDDLQTIVTTRTKVRKTSKASTSDMKQKTRKGDKCMSRNAIAARENREKKKEYIQKMEKHNEKLVAENTHLREKNNALTVEKKNLEKERNYFQAIVANVPQIAALIDHVMKAPNIAFVGTSFGSEVAAKGHSSSMDASLRKSQRIASKIENPGICLHIANKNMSLELCAKCSEASKRLVKMKQK